MATAPTPQSGISSILTILQIALAALGGIPVIGGDAALAGVFLRIIQNAMTAYHAAAGAPLDLTKLPIEQPVP